MIPSDNNSSRSREEAFQLWLEQNRLMWSRVQTVTATEAGVLTGAFAIWKNGYLGLASLLLFVGGCVVVGVSLLMARDAQYMAACQATALGFPPRAGKPLFGIYGRPLVQWGTFAVGVGDWALAMLLWFGG